MNKLFVFQAIMFLTVATPVLAAQVSVSQITAQFNQTSVQYRVQTAYPASMKQSPPVATWTSNLPCGSLVMSTKDTVVWDMADASQLPKCPLMQNGSAIHQDGIIYLHIKSSNGEEYNCTYDKGSRTGLGSTCTSGPIRLNTQERIPVIGGSDDKTVRSDFTDPEGLPMEQSMPDYRMGAAILVGILAIVALSNHWIRERLIGGHYHDPVHKKGKSKD